MSGSFDHVRHRKPMRRGLRVGAVLLMSIALSASCSSSDSAGDDTTAPESTDAAGAESVPSSIDDSTDDPNEATGGSGPDGTYVVGDTYSDGDFEFTYEGMVKVPLDSQGEYSEGECFFAVGSVTFLAGPMSEVTDSDAFSPAFAPIIGGALDTEQNDEFFNCDSGAVGDLGYEQSATTDIAVGDTAGVWLDAIYLSPDQTGQLDGFQLYGDETLAFSPEVTEDVSG